MTDQIHSTPSPIQRTPSAHLDEDHTHLESPDAPICRLLAISGSLRSASSNTAILRAAVRLAPPGTEISIYQGLGDLPHFNPDLDIDPPPPSVADFRAQLKDADGLLISSPEYAHGVPGVLKNALDWLVRSGELVDKPVAVIDNLPRGAWALASLKEILTVMTACLIEETSFTLPLPTNNIDEAGILSDQALSQTLRSGIDRFARAIQRRRSIQEERPTDESLPEAQIRIL